MTVPSANGHDSPDPFKSVCRLWHQDADLSCNSEEELAQHLTAQLSAAERDELCAYLAALLNGSLTASEVKGIWNRELTDWAFARSSAALRFTRTMRDTLEAKR